VVHPGGTTSLLSTAHTYHEDTVYSFSEQRSHAFGVTNIASAGDLVHTSSVLDLRSWHSKWSVRDLSITFPSFGVVKVSVRVSHPDLPVACSIVETPKSFAEDDISDGTGGGADGRGDGSDGDESDANGSTGSTMNQMPGGSSFRPTGASPFDFSAAAMSQLVPKTPPLPLITSERTSSSGLKVGFINDFPELTSNRLSGDGPNGMNLDSTYSGNSTNLEKGSDGKMYTKYVLFHKVITCISDHKVMVVQW
jgi:hypothetical protein